MKNFIFILICLVLCVSCDFRKAIKDEANKIDREDAYITNLVKSGKADYSTIIKYWTQSTYEAYESVSGEYIFTDYHDSCQYKIYLAKAYRKGYMSILHYSKCNNPNCPYRNNK